MNRLRIGVSATIGGGAALLFVGVHTRGPSLLPVVGDRAAAQTPSKTTIIVKPLPHTKEYEEDPWHRFEITVPPTIPPLDMHVAFLVDGKGQDNVTMEPHSWDQPLPFKYRLDSDGDGRVKDILEAQGFPVKRNLVTYRFASGSYGWVGFSKTIRFQHSPGGALESSSGTSSDGKVTAMVGQKIFLENRLLSDTDFQGNLSSLRTPEEYDQPEYAPKTAPGLVHHLSVYLMFMPHQGPPVKVSRTYSHAI